MASDLSLIPQNRIKDLSTTFDGCVHKTGNETISGIKTFTDTPIVLKSGSSEMIIKSSDKDSTVTPESNYQVGHYVISDKNNRWGGYWYCEKRNDGSVRNSLETRRYLTDGTYKHGAIEVWQNANDQCYCAFGGAGTNLSLSGADSSTSSNIIPTKGWVNNPATSTNVVHRSGNETIDGTKAFTSRLEMNMSNPQIRYKDTAMTRGTAPSSNLNYTLAAWVDKDNKEMGYIQKRYSSDGYWGLGLQVTDGTVYKTLGIAIDSSGNVKAESPTPATSDNSTNIATTNWVRTLGFTPNYSTQVGISLPYTAPANGFISGVLTAAHSENYYIAVNNIQVQRIYGETKDVISTTGGTNTVYFYYAR